MVKFGDDVSFEQAGQIGNGGDKLIPLFLSEDDQRAARSWKGGAASGSRAKLGG
jgi:hypothetical protein